MKAMKTQPQLAGLDLTRRGLIAGVAVGAMIAPAALASALVSDAPVSPDLALSRLVAGNARFVAGRAKHPRSDRSRRAAVAVAQHPFATILACADSRTAPELIFDQGLGDLFVVRVAGNVVDDEVLASIEYSVIHLGSTLIMVLGHQRCGAVKATMDALDGHPSDDDKDTRIGALADRIAPAVMTVPASTPNRLAAAIAQNTVNSARALFASSPPLRSRVLSGKLRIVAAGYDLDDGRVTPDPGFQT
jgi:carbonic anhydrase